MVKKRLKIILLLSFLFIGPACFEIESTYQRKDITNSIKRLCKEEYGLVVKTQEIEDTLWIYAPFDNLVTETGTLDKEADEKLRNVILSLHRVMLSIDKPPNFYAFVASDIKDVGADFILIGLVPDIVKVQLRFISRDEFFKRRFVRFTLNPEALGDEEGSHIQKSNHILNVFSRGKDASYFKVNLCKGSFDSQTKNFHVKIDITLNEELEYPEDIPSPFAKALEISAYYIHKVYDFDDFVYLQIEDLASGRIQTLNKKALEEVELN
jgi:hypothetical protein